jgi:hypothetical protein
MRSRSIAGALAFAAIIVTTATAVAVRQPARKLQNSAPSIEVLVERFLAAIAAQDRQALHHLRVTEAEYLETILPGNVPKGQALRDWPADVKRFYWNLLNDKSAVYEAHLLTVFGGRRYRAKSMAYDKGTQEYATYNAYKQLRLELEDSEGTSMRLATGSIAEVNGKFKFISFVRD